MIQFNIATQIIRFTALGLLVGGLSACAPSVQDSQWTESESPKENKVLSLHQSFDVHFDAGKDSLSPAEKARLAAFLSREDIGYNDHITLAVAADDGGKDKGLAARRQTAVSAYLWSLHLRAAADPLGRAALDQVTVLVDRYVVVPPKCPDWRKPSEDDPSNTPSSNLDCANETNLGLMVADPADLVTGKSNPIADAEHSANSIQRYRQGYYKVPDGAYEKAPNEFAKGTGVPQQQSGSQSQGK